jgi:mannose-6-phosphate isomerase-like protein (cupin superfamily)
MHSTHIPTKLASFSECWSPKIVASLNGQEVKLARLSGAFVWHKHDEADELFYVLEGRLRMEFRDGPAGERSVVMGVGDMLVVPRGVEHRPVAEVEPCAVMLFEPAGVVNTGDAERGELTNEAERI